MRHLPTLHGRSVEYAAANKTDAIPDLKKLWSSGRDRLFTLRGTPTYSFLHSLIPSFAFSTNSDGQSNMY